MMIEEEAAVKLTLVQVFECTVLLTSVQWTMIQVAATGLSKLSCSLAEGAPENGSFSVVKDVPEDGVTLATGQNGDEDATGTTLPDCASTAPSCRIGASTLDLTPVGATDIIALPSSVVGVVIERDAADGNAHALDHCAGTAPPSGIGASTVVLVSAVKLTIASDLGTMTIGEEVAVERTLIQVDATSSSVPSGSLAEVVTETEFSSGATDVQQDGATLATGQKGNDDAAAPTLPDCASRARSCSPGALTLNLTEVGVTDKVIGVDATVVLKATCDVGRTTFQEAVVVHRLSTKVNATIFGTPTSFIVEAVTERGAAGGSAIDLAGCASTAASSGSYSAEVFEVGATSALVCRRYREAILPHICNKFECDALLCCGRGDKEWYCEYFTGVILLSKGGHDRGCHKRCNGVESRF